jgi:hypothetical protein
MLEDGALGGGRPLYSGQKLDEFLNIFKTT